MTATEDAPMSNLLQGAALVSFTWSSIVFLVQSIGLYKLFRYLSRPLPLPVSPKLPQNEVPHVTIIRPNKGKEPGLYQCLASTFRQEYPLDKLTIYLCVASTSDPAYPILQQLVSDFPQVDASVLVEEEDPRLYGSEGHIDNLGPNPKIRNISRAYRETKGDVVWILDCNVWVGKNAAGRLVDKLFGIQANGTKTTPYKLVHQLPIVVDVESSNTGERETVLSDPGSSQQDGTETGLMGRGGRLEQMFMATEHAKFYSAINTVGVAPCIVGKSCMFRKSHLDRFTDPAQNPILSSWEASRGQGIDFFSSYICEDHLLGDLIWRSQAPGHKNHALVNGEIAIQPMSGMSIAAYVARRVRWLRVRKWTVLAATLVEPGVESLLCSLHFSFAFTTLPWLYEYFDIPPTWKAMGALWLMAVSIWMLLDRRVTCMLYELRSVEVDENTPCFARGTARQGGTREPSFLEWLPAWLGREFLAMPIWTWAVLLGTTVTWRGRKFRVNMDMSVVEMTDDGQGQGRGRGQKANNKTSSGHATSSCIDPVDANGVRGEPNAPRSRSKGPH